MKRIMFIPALVTVLFMLSSCRKESSLDLRVGEPIRSPFLLDKVEYKGLQATAYFVYNSDSTVKQVVHATSSAGSEVNYTYHNRQVVKAEVPGSLYTREYGYANGLLASETNTQQGQGVIGFKLEYQYDASGILKKMLHYKLDEAGKHLQATITYQYNAKGLPEKITSVQANATIAWTITNYSDSCYLEAKVFNTGYSLSEFYGIYNYPVFSRLNQLPGKITETLTVGQSAPKVQTIYENSYTITNKKLEKLTQHISYPDHPGSNSSEDLEFFYK